METTIKVGLTGGIGSGKSLVCRIFNCLRVPIYNSDAKAKDLMTTDQDLKGKIVEVFGNLAYHADGSLNRAYLSQKVFSSTKHLAALNNIVHPQVIADFKRWETSHKKHKYIINETALLFESGHNTTIDKVITVFAPESIKIINILKRDPHRSETEIRTIISNQWSDEEKVRRADYVIYNDNRQMLLPQVLRIHEILTSVD